MPLLMLLYFECNGGGEEIAIGGGVQEWLSIDKSDI